MIIYLSIHPRRVTLVTGCYATESCGGQVRYHVSNVPSCSLPARTPPTPAPPAVMCTNYTNSLGTSQSALSSADASCAIYLCPNATLSAGAMSCHFLPLFCSERLPGFR